MPVPDPEPGLIVAYDFLWFAEAELGLAEGRKTRPCVALYVNEDAETRERWVAVVPVTHTAPPDLRFAVELPVQLKRHLALDAERSWVVLSEINYFVWPGFDLRHVSKREQRFEYGQLPPGSYRSLIGRFREVVAASAKIVRR